MAFPTYVISLAGAVERRRASAEALARLGLEFSFVEAVDGRKLSPEALAEVYDRKANAKEFKRPLSGPEIGCYLSHLEIWRALVASTCPAVLVLEDDFRPRAGAAEALERLAGYDLCDVMVKLDAGGRGRGVAIGGGFRLSRPRDIPPRTTGYVVGREAARRLLAVRARFFRPIDLDLEHDWEHRVPILVLAPQILDWARPEVSASSLSPSRDQAKPTGAIARLRANLAYQVKLKAGRWRHARGRRAYALAKLAPASVSAKPSTPSIP